MRKVASLLVAFSIVSAVFGPVENTAKEKDADPKKLSPEEKAAKERLDYMFESAAGFVGTRQSDGAKLKIFKRPLLRFTNPLHGCREGLFVAWVDPQNRPVAVGQVFLMRGTENNWYIETQSLGEGPLHFTSDANSIWTPRKPGIEWKSFTGKTITPAKSKVARLSQMRRLARRFDGEDDLSTKANRLRLISTDISP